MYTSLSRLSARPQTKRLGTKIYDKRFPRLPVTSVPRSCEKEWVDAPLATLPRHRCMQPHPPPPPPAPPPSPQTTLPLPTPSPLPPRQQYQPFFSRRAATSLIRRIKQSNHRLPLDRLAAAAALPHHILQLHFAPSIPALPPPHLIFKHSSRVQSIVFQALF